MTYWLRKGWPRLPSRIRSVTMTGLSMGMPTGRELDLDQDLDLDPSFGFVEEAFDGGGYFLVG